MNKKRPNKEPEYLLDELLQLFRSNNSSALRAFVAQCPQTPLKATIQNAIREYASPDVVLLGLNMLAEPYSRGIDPQLGITLSKAVYFYSQELFTESSSTAHLRNAARAAVNCAIGLNAIGKHEELITFVASAEQRFEKAGYLDVLPDLLLYRIEALVELGHYEQAAILLDQTEWKRVLTNHPTHYIRKSRLSERVTRALTSATQLRTYETPKPDKDVIKESRRTMVQDFAATADILPPELADMVRSFVAKSLTDEQLEKDLPDSLPKWAMDNQKRVDHLTDLLSGKPADAVLRDYLKTIGRPDLTEKLLGGNS